ncbi:MAG: UDP-N-acetylmuramate--L-alanine ligase [Nitrospinota bacterium]|nr:UDP-N-acetylmuramate--L-alanine ligase [Nitrospinota bacterium]MDH5678625.1 UDP-N-acetylmuramate--L-alanine ligase [Nitrospinota bacterium]MDH5755398.1 UDP-N-acetylmuramate--L-alanine ligase [Nitrospinota bacterium]
MKFGRTKQLHFIGIGGSGMSGIAEILLNMGYTVTGSDMAESAAVRHLKSQGAMINLGHAAANVGDADVVVISSAVKKDNPEIVEARRLFIPVIPRAQMLAELMRMKHSVAVAGSHGKTTTTSMSAAVLSIGGLDPTIIIGGRVDRLGSGARLGKGDFLVAEADESDGSFLRLYPTVAVVTNIDAEHLDHYGTFDAVKEAFVEFVNKPPFYGAAILCLDDPSIQEIIPRVERRFRTYGISAAADIIASGMEYSAFGSSFDVIVSGQKIGRAAINMPGVHNVYNSLAAIAVGLELEMDPKTAIEALSGFSGVERRCQLKGERDGVMVIDDYGHHPSEIKATLRGLKTGFPDKKLIVVFQPHRYSRTKNHMSDFGKAFYDADELVVTEIYAAGEEPIEGVSGEMVASEARAYGARSVTFIADIKDVPAHLARTAKAGDMVITLGAGSVVRVGEWFIGGNDKDT